VIALFQSRSGLARRNRSRPPEIDEFYWKRESWMDTQRTGPAVLALAAGLLIPVALGAQEERETPSPVAQEATLLTVRLTSVGDVPVTGQVIVKDAATTEERTPTQMATAPVEVQFDLRGFESDQQITAVVHEGSCATSTTRVGELGTLSADADGRVATTKTISQADIVAVLRGEVKQDMARSPEEQEDKPNPDAGTYHIQVQAGTTPLACGDFKPDSSS
jgi:hypothetical protein